MEHPDTSYRDSRTYHRFNLSCLKFYKMKKTIFLSIGFLFLLSTNIYTQEVPKWLHGEWEGIGYQAPTNSAWNIELNYDAQKKSFSINYPTLNCSGHWELIESKENRLVFVEKITEGLDKCDNNVKVIVNYVEESFISVAYFLPGIYENVVASSVLKKKVLKVKKL